MERKKVIIEVVRIVDIDEGSTVEWEATVEYGNEKKKMNAKSKEEIFKKVMANIPISKEFIGGKPEFPPEYY